MLGKDNPNNMGHIEVFLLHVEKADLRGENEHAPPANRGPTGNGQDGGRRGELLHLTEVSLFFPCIPAGQR